MPGRLSGSTTWKKVRVRFAPRLIAACSRFGWIPFSEPMMVSTVYGRSACERPMMMAPVLGMKAMRSLVIPINSKTSLATPKRLRMMYQP
jgi:hypothetical protein